MNELQLHIKSIDFNNLTIGTTPIWGEIHIEVNGRCFPNDSWFDSLSSILDMWLFEVIETINKQNTHCILRFMDGPYLVHLSIHLDRQIIVSCRDYDGIEYMQGIVDYHYFIQNLLTCTEFFIESCRQNAPYFITNRVGLKIIRSYYELKGIFSNLINGDIGDSSIH